MTTGNIERLDCPQAAQREQYERAFYTAFARAAGNRLIRKLWLWDDAARRVATRIAYDEQIVYVMRDSGGRIVTGMGVNCAMRTFQSAAYGFAPPREREGCCEFLTLFSVGEYRLRTRFQFRRESFADLVERGFHTAYATTAHRVLQVYLRQGAQVLAQREIEGEARYFLRFDLKR